MTTALERKKNLSAQFKDVRRNSLVKVHTSSIEWNIRRNWNSPGNISLLIPKFSPNSNFVPPSRMSMVICDVCGLNTRLYNLSRHKRMVHEKIKNVFCDVCGHGFYIKRRLADHLKVNIEHDHKVSI